MLSLDGMVASRLPLPFVAQRLVDRMELCVKAHSLLWRSPAPRQQVQTMASVNRVHPLITLCLCMAVFLLTACRDREPEAPPATSPPIQEETPLTAPVVQTTVPTPSRSTTVTAPQATAPDDQDGSANDAAGELAEESPVEPLESPSSQQPVRVTPLESSLPPLSQTRNVLVLGSDRRPNEPNWRTDVIMIVAMNMESGQAGVISVPRDVYIDSVPNHYANRINVFDYLGEQDEPGGGGPKLVAQIIEDKMGIPIHHYLRFDFDGFKEVVDALGGLEITLDCPVSDFLPQEDIAIRLSAGTHRLDGREALSLVRTRRQGGDLERSRRQQRVVWAVREQIRRENLITRVPALYAALHDTIQTDIGLVAAIRYVRFALTLDEEDVHGIVLSPPDMLQEGWRSGMFVFLANWDRISEQVQTIFDRPPLVETSTVVSEPGVAANPEAPRCP